MTAAAKRATSLSLADIQDLLQAAILSGDDAILECIEDNSRTDRETLFGVYRHAYVGRLIDTLKAEYPLFARHVGDERFDAIARRFIATHPSRTQNARWFGSPFPAFLEALGGDGISQDALGLSQIEKAVSDAFDAPDAPVLAVTKLGLIAPDSWGRMIFAPHPSVTRLNVACNSLDLWRALKTDEVAPASATGTAKRPLLVWRHGLAPMVRELSYEENMVWTEACRGERFESLCEMLATYDDPSTAAVRAAGYLQGWLTSEMLTSVRLSDERPRADRTVSSMPGR